jgi:hypothetical protein
MNKLFLSLSDEDKVRFVGDLVDFGLVHEINPDIFRGVIKIRMKESKGRLKRLYRKFRELSIEQRNKFFGEAI